MILRQSDQLEIDEGLLHLALDDAPERFDRVQLRAVRGHEHELEVEILRQLSDFFGVVGCVVVQDHKHFFIGIPKLFTKQAKKLNNARPVGSRSLHEDRPLKTRADGAEDSDTRATELRVGPLHSAVWIGPCACAPHPHMKRRLVEID